MGLHTILGFFVIVAALKLAESTGGLEFEGWSGGFGAAVACWLGLLAFPDFPGPDLSKSPVQLQALSLAIQMIVTMIMLLIAWAVVPGARVKRFSGLILA